MAFHQETRALPYTPDQMFELVADVESYPAFLPLWREARIRRLTDSPPFETYRTSQVIQLGPAHRRFVTETRMQRPDRIVIESDDPFFKRFSINWSFSPAPVSGCRVSFRLDCEARPVLMRPVFDLVLNESAHGIMRAFEGRARALYGLTG